MADTAVLPLSLAQAPVIVQRYYAEVIKRVPDQLTEPGSVEIAVVSPGIKLPKTAAMGKEIIEIWDIKDLNEAGVALLRSLVKQEIERRIHEQERCFECTVAWCPVIEANDLKYVDYSRSELMALWH